MTQRRSIRTALLALTMAVAYFMAAAVLAGPAQAAATDSVRASTGTSADSGSFARMAYDPAKISATKTKAAAVKTVAKARPDAAVPLVGFCTFDGYNGVTSFIGCSIVAPATVYVYCSNGNIFYGYLPAAGIYSLTATPCYATGYSLV